MTLSGPPAGPSRVARVGLLVLLGVYVAARIVILLRGNVFTSYDTITYALRGDPAIDRGSLVSLTGDAPRLWGVPAFYAVLPSDELRVIGQWLIGTAAWVTLAWVLWTLLRTTAGRLSGAGLVLVLALHDAVGIWDLALLSESLSISLGVLVLAGLLRWAASGSRAWLGLSAAAGFWWTFTRPDIRVITVLLILGLGIAAWGGPRARRASEASLRASEARTRHGMPDRRRAALISAGILLVAVAWCTAIVPNTSQANTRYTPFGAEHAADEWLLFRLRVQVLPEPAVKAVFTDKLGMPACPAAEAIATRPDWDILEFADAYYACPDLAAWGAANRDTAFRRFAVAAPVEYARMTVGLVNESLLGDTNGYADTPAVIPPPLQKVAFPGPRFALIVVLLGLAAAVAAALVTRARRVDRVLVDGAYALGGVSLVSLLAGVLYGTGEFSRFGIQEAIGLRLTVILLLVGSLDAYLWQRNRNGVNLAPRGGGVGATMDGSPTRDG